MITTVTLNPALDREYFISKVESGIRHFIYAEDKVRVSPGGKGVISAINLKNLGYQDVQNIGFVGGRQGLFFEKMVQKFEITTNYIYTDYEIRNNVFLIGTDPMTYTTYNDYTYQVDREDIDQLLKRFKRGITDSEYIMISGSIPTGVSFDIYQQLISICHESGKKVYLNSSGEVMQRALCENPLVVVPYFKHSRRLMEHAINTFEDYIWAGKQLQDKGARYVIMPYHENRLLFDEDSVYLISPKEYSIKSWHGASEAYNATFFDYIYQKGFDFIEASRYAAAAALSVAEKNDIYLSGRDEVLEKLDKIILRKVEV